MEETNFILLWKEQYEKIDQSLVINQQILRELITRKAEKAMRSLAIFTSRGILAAVIYLLLLGAVLFYAVSHYTHAADYFIISIGFIFLINLKALYDYIKHLAWIRGIDYDGNVVEIQQRLAVLHASILQHTRIMFLQLPFWSTFYLSPEWFPKHTPAGWVIWQVLLTLIFVFVAIWLYRNLTKENAGKKWVKALLKGSGAGYIIRATEFYQEIESFRKEL
jgi:hypothetical protein